MPKVTTISPSDPLFEQARLRHGLPKGLLQAFAERESGFNPKAVSETGARGLFQFTRRTGKSYGLHEGNFYDPHAQANAAANYLADLYQRTGGSWSESAARYYGKNHDDWPDYVKGIRRNFRKYAGADLGTTRASVGTPEGAPDAGGGLGRTGMPRTGNEVLASVFARKPWDEAPIQARTPAAYLRGGASDPTAEMFQIVQRG